MKIRIVFVSIMVFLLTNCKEKECNKGFKLNNNSNQMVVFAKMLESPSTIGKCILDTSPIEPKFSHFITSRICWEEKYFVEGYYHFFILDTLNYPIGFGPYDLIQCDSIYQKFRVLKEYKLTLEDLQKNNFIINYP